MEQIINMQLITNEISIKNNNLPIGNFNVSPKFTRNIGSVDDTHIITELRAELINTEENPFPVDIIVSISGVFDVRNIPAEQMENFSKIQTVHILMPYIRSMITTVTAGAFMPPIVLPVFDANQIFADC